MKKIFIIYFLLFSIKVLPIFAKPKISLLNIIEDNPLGSYVIFENNQTHIGIILKDKQPNKLVLHEICFLKNSFKKVNDWKEHLKNGEYFAKFETTIEGNKTNSIPLFQKKNKQISKEQFFSITSILTSLSFSPISPNNMKKTKDSLNNSVLWKPKLIVEGKVIDYPECVAYEAYWPKDNSIMSNKKIEIYLPLVEKNNFLCFPIWSEIETPLGKVKIRAIDSGILN